jgi:hypothetical protein
MKGRGKLSLKIEDHDSVKITVKDSGNASRKAI